MCFLNLNPEIFTTLCSADNKEFILLAMLIFMSIFAQI